MFPFLYLGNRHSFPNFKSISFIFVQAVASYRAPTESGWEYGEATGPRKEWLDIPAMVTLLVSTGTQKDREKKMPNPGTYCPQDH